MVPIRPIHLLLVLCLPLSAVQAHESPEHTLEHLNQHQNLTPAQLHQRAIAKRALKKYPEAIEDLQAAIARSPKQIGYQLELARIQLSAGQFHEAIHSTEHALPLAKTAEQGAEIHVIRADVYQLAGQPEKSLASLSKAFQQIPNGHIEWYLLRSENQRTLGHHQQRIADLESGLKHHPSAVLKSHWIDALIDAGKFSTALEAINQELSDRRWKSNYLIKRARALIGLKRQDEAQTDLRSALAEIEPRINPQHPDLLLLADQATAYSLLGQGVKAQQITEQLKAHHAPQWILDRLQEPAPKK